jgi:hypothetical protein
MPEPSQARRLGGGGPCGHGVDVTSLIASSLGLARPNVPFRGPQRQPESPAHQASTPIENLKSKIENGYNAADEHS